MSLLDLRLELAEIVMLKTVERGTSVFGFGGGDLKRRRAIIENSFAAQASLAETHFRMFREQNPHINASAYREWEVTAFVAWAFYMAVINCGAKPADQPKLQETLNHSLASYLQERLSKLEPHLVEPGRRARFAQIVNNVQSRAFEFNEAFERDKVGVIDAERRGEFYVPGLQVMYRFLQNAIADQADVDRVQEYSMLNHHILPQCLTIMSSLK